MQQNTIINKTSQNINTTQDNSNSKIILDSRKYLSLNGVDEVLSSNENYIILKTSGSKLQIIGTNISIIKLDIANKVLEASGIFSSLKFLEKQDNIFKRVFK